MKYIRSATLAATLGGAALLALPAAAQDVMFEEVVVIAAVDMGPFHRADDIIGSEAYTVDGKKIHEVKDIVLDAENRAVAIIVGVGGFLGIDETDVAIPMARVTLSPEGRGFRVQTDLTEEDLRLATRS